MGRPPYKNCSPLQLNRAQRRQLHILDDTVPVYLAPPVLLPPSHEEIDKKTFPFKVPPNQRYLLNDHDWQTLDPSKYLNGSVIDAYSEILNNWIILHHEDESKMCVLPTTAS